jgi:hypothetical protein
MSIQKQLLELVVITNDKKVEERNQLLQKAATELDILHQALYDANKRIIELEKDLWKIYRDHD